MHCSQFLDNYASECDRYERGYGRRYSGAWRDLDPHVCLCGHAIRHRCCEVLNTAVVTADDPPDTEVTGKSDGDNDANADSGKDADNDPTNDPVVVTLDQTASLSVTKSTTSTDKTVAGGATSFDVGDTITYSVAVTNTGN